MDKLFSQAEILATQYNMGQLRKKKWNRQFRFTLLCKVLHFLCYCAVVSTKVLE